MSVWCQKQGVGSGNKGKPRNCTGLCIACREVQTRGQCRSNSSDQTRGRSLLGGMPGDRPRSGGLVVSTLSPFCSNMARRLRTPLIVAVALGGTAREERRAVSGRQGARDGDGKSGGCDGYVLVGSGSGSGSGVATRPNLLELPLFGVGPPGSVSRWSFPAPRRRQGQSPVRRDQVESRERSRCEAEDEGRRRE